MLHLRGNILLSLVSICYSGYTVVGYSITNLDNSVTTPSIGMDWGFYEDGNRQPEYAAEYANDGSDLTFWGDEDSLPYSMIHFYKNAYLPTQQQQDCSLQSPKEFCFETKWRYGVAADPTQPTTTTYDQPTYFNNECVEGLGCWTSKIQAIEFSSSRWECDKRNEIALQWCNICGVDDDWHTGVPVWRYWDQGWLDMPHSCGVTDTMSKLPHNTLHNMKICAIIDGTETIYQNMTVGDWTIDLTSCLGPVLATESSTTSPLLAAAIQLDGTSKNYPFRVHVQDMQLNYE